MHNKVVQRLMFLVSTVQLYHWNTHKYSKHLASDALYNDLQVLVDKFIESFYGRFGQPSSKELKEEIPLKIKTLDNKHLVRYLNKTIEDLKNGILGAIADRDNGLSSIRDEMITTISKGIYLLKMSS
jgi:DNA-binding ferritin-like protein